MKSRLFVTCFLAVIGAAAAFGQTSKGTLTGTVLDSSGSAVADAQVTATDTQGSETRTVRTGSSGDYRIDAITPSVYHLSVTAPGFSRKEIAGIQVTSSIVTSQNITLEVGVTEQTISVEASGTPIQTENGQLSSTIDSAEIAKLPINSLNPIDLVLTQPGVSGVAGRDSFTNGSGFSVNGLRPRSNNFLIDGFDNNDQAIGGQALQPQNLEAIKEVSVLRNSYAPEFGRGGGSVTNVIYKNGTNQYHGALWERYTGNALDALTSEQKRSGLTSAPRNVDNTFGFAIGGPVLKNKLFLFGSSQWHRIFGAESGNQLNVPTAAGLAELQALSAAFPNAAILVNSLGGLTAATQPAVSMSAIAPDAAAPASSLSALPSAPPPSRTRSTSTLFAAITRRALRTPSPSATSARTRPSLPTCSQTAVRFPPRTPSRAAPPATSASSGLTSSALPK